MTVEKIVFTTKYKDNKGEEKNSYTEIGTIFTNEKGQKSMKLDFIPTDLKTGFLNIYPQEKKEN